MDNDLTSRRDNIGVEALEMDLDEELREEQKDHLCMISLDK